MDDDCAYCHLAEPTLGGWVYTDEHWVVQHGPAETTMPGALRITARRHFIDFADMTAAEAGTFGTLLKQLDTALRACTDAERVHLVSTRDRVRHFHAWLYPRSASHPLRGTAFLDAPQHTEPTAAHAAAHAIRAHLGSEC